MSMYCMFMWCIHMYASVNMNVHACRGQADLHVSSSTTLSLIAFRQGLSLIWKFPVLGRFPSRQALGDLPVSVY